MIDIISIDIALRLFRDTHALRQETKKADVLQATTKPSTMEEITDYKKACKTLDLDQVVSV